MPPVQGRPLILYLTVLDNSMGCVLGQHDESGRREHAIYYLSKKFTECETRYSLLEKTCCALAWAARRLRQYMLSHTTWLVSKMDRSLITFVSLIIRANQSLSKTHFKRTNKNESLLIVNQSLCSSDWR